MNRLLILVALVFMLPLTGHTKSNSQGNNSLGAYENLSSIFITVRHGESVPSSEKRVCSTMDSGTDPKNGLTPKGREEITQTATAWIEGNKKLIASYLKQGKLVIVTSPFSRTKETADLIADLLQQNFKKSLPKSLKGKSLRSLIVVENDIRERNFGKFEGELKSDVVYKKVWEQDVKNPDNTKWNVESASAVQARASKVIADLEESGKADGGRLYIVVAHGDTLKITQTAFQRQSASEHCNAAAVKPYKTAEFRELKLAPKGATQAAN